MRLDKAIAEVLLLGGENADGRMQVLQRHAATSRSVITNLEDRLSRRATPENPKSQPMEELRRKLWRNPFIRDEEMCRICKVNHVSELPMMQALLQGEEGVAFHDLPSLDLDNTRWLAEQRGIFQDSNCYTPEHEMITRCVIEGTLALNMAEPDLSPIVVVCISF
jgi:hypothetical protein